MRYVVHTAKVVSGIAFSYPAYILAAESDVFSLFLIFSAIVLFGLALVTHGLFTGIEIAVAAGNERAGVDRSTD